MCYICVMKITYYLNEGRTKNLYCRISDGDQRVTFSLGYTVDPVLWNAKKEEVSFEDNHFFTLKDFKAHLEKRYYILKSEMRQDIPNILKEESAAIVSKSGIQGIARNMFDEKNEIYFLPKYDEFIMAFEKFTNLKEGDYKVRIVDHVVYFFTEEVNYEMDTSQGKTAYLKSIIDGQDYDEIFSMTNENIWSLIYIDAGIEKHVFLSTMIKEWAEYWDKRTKEAANRGKTVDKQKEFSWKQFQIYMECYDGHGDSIKLAYEIEDAELYPIAVITMMNIFDPEVCYSEYCDYEFSDDEWESIYLGEDDDDDNNLSLFYIRETELFN